MLTSGKIQVAAEDYYLTADKTRAVKRGDPEATFLLARKGTPLDAGVAEHYGLATEEADAVAGVQRDPEELRRAVDTPGTGVETARTYERMATEADIRKDLPPPAAHLDRLASGSASRQAAMMVEGRVNEATGNTVDNAGQTQPGQMRQTLTASPAEIASVADADGERAALSPTMTGGDETVDRGASKGASKRTVNVGGSKKRGSKRAAAK